MPTPRTAVLAVALAIGAACVPPAAREQVEEAQAGRQLEPSFAPTSEAPGATTPSPTAGSDLTPSDAPTPDAPTPTDAAVPSPAPAAPDPSTSEPAPAAVRGSAAVQDPAGDVEEPLLADPPAYADLRAGSLEVDGPDVTLSVSFHADTPERSDEDHTMNVASFYDVDGDGRIDYEVWGNLSSTGWGTSWFDNREGKALFGSDDEVGVEVTRDALVLRFPRHYLGGAETFRWALAAEWGTYEALATGRMTSDQAPDEGRPAPFPG